MPATYSELVLSDVIYRQARLKITVHGHGTKVREFRLDGQKQRKPFFAAASTGEHQVEIEMK